MSPRSSSRPLARSLRFLPLAFACAFGAQACSRGQSADKVPLGQTSTGEAAGTAASTLPAATRAALDQGNTEFRAGHYAKALEAYRAAAKASPAEAAPYFGIYMAAEKLGNKALADSANRAIGQRNGAQQMLSDSMMKQLHQGATAPAATAMRPKATGK